MIWFNVVFAAAGFLLPPFGTVPDSIKSGSSWHGFETNDSVIFIARVSREQVSSEQCKGWMKALDSDSLGSPFKLNPDETVNIELLEQSWSPWKADDKEIVSECSEVPCKVKLNSTENAKIVHSASDTRPKGYLQIVVSRIRDYLKSRKHRGYEFPGEPFDVWNYFKTYQFQSRAQSRPPGLPQIWARKIDFGSARARVLRQILDRQSSFDAKGTGITVWIRDIYTDHYFDSWGEWIQIQCDSPKKGELTFIHVLALDFDLLKKGDLASKLARGSMKSAIKKQGMLYLDQQFERVKNRSPNK